ncbi:hypothetical protein QJS04_geneDACA000727 [Acorus gramineus]|uniref:Reverse transcriptase zinc-binding domain-containing protein n=1 Tax=Acorus gramineus TaxID=55184 RepID=A0AAV9AQ21_ACOGR|nr:hypothetical protein QJS04_geneDACA000727 [Acorus gramineus]
MIFWWFGGLFEGHLVGLGSVETIRFWEDVWLGEAPLRFRFPSIFQIAVVREGLACLFWQGRGDSGYWEMRVRKNLNDDEVDDYLNLLEELHGAQVEGARADNIVWKPTLATGFSVKSGYSWVRRDQIGLPNLAQKHKVCGCKVPLKVRAFIWIFYQGKVLTKSYVARWAPEVDRRCALCGLDDESVEHLFLFCPMVREVWGRMAAVGGLGGPFNSLEELWAAGRRLCSAGDRSVQAKVSQSYIPTVIWSIWLTRNHSVFRGSIPYVENIWELAMRCVVDWGCFCAGASSINIMGGSFIIGM